MFMLHFVMSLVFVSQEFEKLNFVTLESQAGITAIRRVKKSDNNRLARATGASIVSRTDELKEEDIGTKCGLFEVKKFGDEYFCFVDQCEDPKACTIVLRGASRDILKEVYPCPMFQLRLSLLGTDLLCDHGYFVCLL